MILQTSMFLMLSYLWILNANTQANLLLSGRSLYQFTAFNIFTNRKFFLIIS